LNIEIWNLFGIWCLYFGIFLQVKGPAEASLLLPALAQWVGFAIEVSGF